MIRYTVEDTMREGPCSAYPRERVRALWGGSESLSPFDIAGLPIPIDDRLWALWRLLFRLSPHRACRVARLIAIDALDLWDPPDIVVWFLCGGSDGFDASQVVTKAAEAAMSVRCALSARRGEDFAAGASLDAAMALVRAASGATVKASIWSVRTVEEAVRATEAAAENASDAYRATAMKRYLSWVVKAFDPFTPVGDLL